MTEEHKCQDEEIADLEELEFRERMFALKGFFGNKFLKSLRKFAPMKFSVLKCKILELDSTGDIKEPNLDWENPKKRCNCNSMSVINTIPARCSICKEKI